MKIQFFGAVGTTTGSMHLLEANGKRILLECGLYQGKRKEAFERNRNIPFDPASVDVCVLSHAHIDHSGNLPSLLRAGYQGPIFATPATIDLCDIMLADSAHIQMQDVAYVNKKRLRQGKNPFEPLYTPDDVEATMRAFRPVPYGKTVELGPGVALTLHDAGHILGSAFVVIDVREGGTTRRLMFTGDVGRADMPILRDPTVVHDVDVLITESTYGNRRHPRREDVKARLALLIDHITLDEARLIIPSFSVGRTQQIVYFLNELSNEGRINGVPIFVDSPLSNRATAVHEKHTECYDAETRALLEGGDHPFRFPDLTYTQSADDSRKLNPMRGPVVIISASGMCEGGRIQHHLKHTLGEERNIVLFVGYQAQHTLGRRLVEHQSPVRIFGEPFEVRCRISKINALSAHADHDELLGYFRAMGPAVDHAFVVHGEGDAVRYLAADIRKLGAAAVTRPQLGEVYEV